MVLRQKLFLGFVIAGNLALWLYPSNVVKRIALDDPTLLGRYSLGHCCTMVLVLMVSAVALYIDQARSREGYKRRCFQVIASILVIVPMLLIADVALRLQRKELFTGGEAYHRPPNAVYTERVVDKPQARRSYPHKAEGYPPQDCTFHTDARGYRNATTLDSCDVVTVGDSFTEGYLVSDADPWPVRFAELSGERVCNLGMAGYAPFQYLAALKQYGLPLKPKYVICMIYEGNDLKLPRKSRKDTSLSARINGFFRTSPVRSIFERTLTAALEPIGAEWPVANAEAVDWLPLRIPDTADGKYYAFGPLLFLDAYRNKDLFQLDSNWQALEAMLKSLQTTCASGGAQLVLAYAPIKAHVVLPLALDRIKPEQLHAFAAVKSREGLPPPKELMGIMRESLGIMETAISDWCRSEKVPFFSPTEALRAAAGGGEQVYFTYDNHWSPAGHRVVAAALRSFWDTQIAPRPTATSQASTQP